ncbi:MFS family permease [Nocardioides aromaticivorans]|uniref:MFS family permease n=1 Tax=Nocardioides aromaticivorans TaxID=200618 RepID=A0A7Y9ZJC1_9ACTN|nr:MFS transporter [Nocardioides aromaticivorans]NYI46584.1 MFS family permease [Nocardioides aromaticivorans]
MTDPPATREGGQAWSPWRTVVAFGLVSLSADMVYEGMRSVAGPFLGTLGASALTVGIVTGAGEAMALILRLITGPWADKSQRHWRLTVVGYGMTAVCVPLLAVAPALGAAGVAVAATLILLERAGKAVRSPSKSALLARMATGTGRGRGFAVHKALDQVGAFAGPLLVAGVAAVTGVLWSGLALLAIPGLASLLLLAQLRRRVPTIAQPDPDDEEPAAGDQTAGGLWSAILGADLPRDFHLFSLAVALTTAGLMTFGVISFRFVEAGLISLAAAPLVYAMAMGVEAIAALLTGDLFDRYGGKVLLAVPVIVAAVPVLVFAPSLTPVLGGVVLWGLATGIQDSTVKAFVADLVPSRRRATAYGIFAAVQGLGAIAGGVLAGALAVQRPGLLAACVSVLQLASFVLLLKLTRSSAELKH